MTIEHSDAPLGEIHPVANWNYASAEARTGATGFIPSDIGKEAWQQDDDTFWRLKSIAPPVWVPVGAAAAPGTGATAWGGITGLLSAQADLQAALNAKATLADIATAINALVAAAPGALDTINELATALGNDANFAATITAALAGKATPADIAAAKSVLAGNAQSGTSYTLAATDSGKCVTLTNAAAITLTVPVNATVAIPIDSVIVVKQGGAGQVTVSAAVGVTVNNVDSHTKIKGQNGYTFLRKSATDVWDFVGATA